MNLKTLTNNHSSNLNKDLFKFNAKEQLLTNREKRLVLDEDTIEGEVNANRGPLRVLDVDWPVVVSRWS